ncbi:Chitotriosidase-1 [Camponotus floridanus]|uniref:chitinase n=1 Tax=Camponotus floridanus TaxID=104421 RepID=E2ACU7_CAMFO|nr:Chitotriosidase-1 [Camponotus floridanus]
MVVFSITLDVQKSGSGNIRRVIPWKGQPGCRLHYYSDSPGIAERKIVCYYTNWSVYRPGTAKFSPQNINPYLCTHLIYAFGGFTKDNALKPFDKYQDIEKGGYAKFTGLKTYNKNLKTMLAIGGWNEGSSRFSPMVADSERRREFVKNAVKFLRQNHFDGLDLDWEYPAFRDGGKPRDKDNYANLVQELYEEFERESSKTGRPRLLLSMAMPAGIEYIDKGYDVPRLNEYLDFVNLLSYDYHSAYEPAVNHHSPLYPLEEDNEYNYDAELTIDYTISHLLGKGASADKIILGIPTYGRSYTLFNQEATELGSPADGPGIEGEATREKGYLAYYEICENVAESDEWEVVQPNPKAMGPYAFNGNQWVGYDDEDIVKLKARYVNEKKLGGIMFWSVDNDDFRGKCHGRPYPLIEAAKEALLTDNSRNTIENTKSVESRKKIRTQGIQSNVRKYSQRSSTTSAPITSRRASSSRLKYRNISKSKTNDEDEEDRDVARRSYDPSPDEEIEGRNSVRVTEKTERPKNRHRSKTRSSDHTSRRKQSRRKEQSKTDENEESLSNKLTTPEPPTTPDPGTDFKCEDEGFFPHPRDCKKYFWCLDSGPSGLGVVAHQFTCPSGLVFNKAADSCDYPRNVICPKTSKTSVVSTTKSPITAATSRTTYLHSTTTAKAESEEYDSEEEDYEEDDIEETEEEEVKEEPKITTTMKPLVYKTLTRRPSTTTTTRTTKPSEPERASDGEDEEDPRVIKELIDLIRKAGGIEQLEKQLLFQEKNSGLKSDTANVTPTTISRSLYERVLNRQTTNKLSNKPVLSSSETSYVNGPGRAQFEGLDDIPEVKNLRRSQKPQYVTIERSKSSVTKDTDNEDEEAEDNTDVASTEEDSVSNPLESSSSTQRVTPSYVNIRRTRPSTTTSKTENDVEEKEEEVDEEKPTRRRRPYVSKNSKKESDSVDVDLSTEKNDASSTINSRYTNVQRFRGIASKNSENLSSVSPLEITTLPTKLEEYSEVPSSTTDSTTTSASTTSTTGVSTSTEIVTVISVEPPENPSSVSPKIDNTSSNTSSTKLEEDSVTEILITTLPEITSSTTKTTTASAGRSTIAAVSQPRPFGFTRRRFSSSEATTTTSAPLNRSKVSISSRNSTRPASPFLARARSRTRPTNRVVEDESTEHVDASQVETSTFKSKDSSRSRNRGPSRYTSPTSRSRTSKDVSTNSVPSPRYRGRGRTTISTTVSTIADTDTRRKYRRPSRLSSTESIIIIFSLFTLFLKSFRYTNVQRFRGIASKNSENLSSVSPLEITTLPTKLEEYSEVPSSTTDSTTTSASTTSTTGVSTSTEIVTVISVEPPENPSSVSPKIDNTSSNTSSTKLEEDSVTEILITTLPEITSSTTKTTTASAGRSTIAAVSQPRPFGFTRRRFSSSEATTTTSAPLNRSKVSISSRNSTRPASPFLARARSRTRPTNRVVEDESTEHVDASQVETSTFKSKDSSRSRNRGPSRYTSPTSRSRTSKDVSTNSVPSPRYRGRGRTTISTTVSTIADTDTRRKYRRPSRLSSTESIKANELDDSPIVRINQGNRKRNSSLRSRFENNDEESDKVTNIRVFKRPTVNRELYDRTKQKKRNNVQKVNVESKQIASITPQILESSTSTEGDNIEKNDLINIVDQEATIVDSVVESNTIEPKYDHVKPVTLIDITTTSNNKVDYTSDQPDDAIATTITHIETHEFNPNLVIIVSEHGSTSEAPKRRKIILKRRPISSNNTIEAEEEQKSETFRRRKVIKRKRPLQDTSSPTSTVSLEQEVLENSSPVPESTTSIGDTKDVEKSTVTTDQTEITLMNKDAEELPVATGYTREMQDSTLAITETTLSTDYNLDDFAKIILETPAEEISTIWNKETTDSFNNAAISTVNTYTDEEYQSTSEMNFEASTIESTLATATIDNTESTAPLEETLVPELENLSTQIVTTLSTSEPDSTRAQITTRLFTTELDSSSVSKPTFDPRYTRKKFIRKSPVSSGTNTTNQYPPVLSSTENANFEIRSRRRNNLFIRRPVSSTTANTPSDDLKYQEEKEKQSANNRSRDSIEEEVAEDTILKNKSVSADALSANFAEFWKTYTTASSINQISNSSTHNEDIDERGKIAETEDTSQSILTTTNKSEIRPRYKIPVILKRPFDPEEALSPKRYPLDSAPEESEETKETKPRQASFRQPRTRYKLQNRDNFKTEESTSNPEPTSTWQYIRTRSYLKRPSSTSTEATVTETLIPARKFDYAADAFHRKQQSLRTTTPRSNYPFDSQNLVDPDYTSLTTAKPSVTRLITSVTESGTTERQKILIKTKYSSLTSTTRIPADQFSSTIPSIAGTGLDDESVNEIRQGVERSTLPIEGEFNHHYDRFTTESQEPSTIEIESVADSKTIRLPTLKELIGYPTTYYYDRIATTPSSALLHLLRNDVDNDISQQNVEKISFQGTNESQSGEREESARDIIGEETGDWWLQNKARSRISKKIDITLEEAQNTSTPVIQEDEDGRRESSTSMYLRPTTMRGIPPVSLTSTPRIRGFYITKSEDDLPSSTLTVDFTSPYTTIDSSIEQQTEIASTPGISATEETVSFIHNNQNKSEINDNMNDVVTDEVVTRNELELDAFNANVSDIIKSKGDKHEENSSTFGPLVTFSENSDSVENSSIYTEPTVTIPINKSVENKRETSLRNFGYNSSSLSDVYAIGPTTSTRRKIAIALNRYNKASTPLWTGKRIVPKKRNRTAILSKSIKEAERRVDETTFPLITTDTFKNASATSEIPSTLISTNNKLDAISTVPTTLIASESTTSAEMLDVYRDIAYSTDSTDDLQTEDPNDRTNAEATITLLTNINSVIATTPSISEITSITNDSTVISTISDDSTSVTTMASANESIIVVTPSSIVAKTPVVANDQATITTKSMIKSTAIEIPVSTTANYSVAAVPTIASTQAIANDSAITPATTTIGVEITSPIANCSTDFANMIIPATINAEVEATSAITNYSVTAIPINTSTNAIVTDSAVTTAPAITINTEIETSTVADPAVTISTAINTQEIDPTTITTSATTGTEAETTITNLHVFVNTATTMIPTTSTLPSTIISSTDNRDVTEPATSNIPDVDTITMTDMSTTTTPTTVVTSTISDLNLITSANANDPSTFAVTDTSTIPSLPITNSVILSKDSVTSADEASASSTVPTTLIESTTAHFNSNVFNISNTSEVSAITATAKSVQTTEIPTTFETSPIFTSISRSLSSTNSATLSTTAFSETSENFVASMVTQNPSTLFSTITPVTNIAVENATLSAIYDSIATNTIIQTTGVYKSNSVQTTSEKPTTPKIKITSEETASKTIQNREDKTSKLNDQLGQKSVRRRVINRTNNWIGRPVVQQTINQYPPHRATVYRERLQRPPGYTSRVIEENRRRRIVQRRMRVNFEPISSTTRPDENVMVVQNITENYVQNITENHVPYHRARNTRKRMKIVSKRVRERPEEKEITTLRETTSLSQATVTDNKTEATQHEKVHHENGNVERKWKFLLRRIKPQSQENLAADETSANFNSVNESLTSNFQNNFRMSKNLSEQKNRRGRTRVVLKSIRPKSEERSPIEGARGNPDLKKFQGNFPTNFHANKNSSEKGRRMKVLLKRVRPKSKENNSTIEETNGNENLQNNLSTRENFPDEKKIRRGMRVVLKRVRPKFEEEKVKIKEANADVDSTNANLQGALLNFRGGRNFPIEYNTRRTTRVVLRNVKPKFEENNSTIKKTDSDSTNKDLQSSFSNNFYTNVDLSDEEETRKFKSEEKDSIAEETSAHFDFTDKNVSSNFSNREKIATYFKHGKKEATVERLEDIEEQQTTETFVLAEQDTDQPSLEINSSKNGGSVNRKLGHAIRHRKPSTTPAPLINSFPSTVAIYRNGRPIETTFSSRVDLVDAFEDTRSTVMQDDQKPDVSDQSIRAQEFAVTLADPPLSSSSDTGRTVLRDAARRKISTTVAPRTDPNTIDRTISRYDADFRNRQRPKTQSTRPIVNTTTRPRRPSVLDYDYYEDDVPIVSGKSFLNSKLFLTSKGTIRCLDQGNFPHPYSCKKFITCTRMLNGQIIGTEYTCPDKLTFDPVGGICNWSAGLGCNN